MKTSRVKVDPATATEWLGFNTHNRSYRAGMVSAYAAAMKAGDWRTDIDPIAFAGELGGRGKKAPVLLNGQHRLHALISADTTLEFLVVEGLALEDQSEMDAGVKRQLGDHLRMQGLIYPHDTAAVLRLVWAYENSTMRTSISTTSYATLLRFLKEHPDLPDSVPPAKRVWAAIGGRASVYGAAHYILSCLPDAGIEEEVEEFYDKLLTGEALPPGSAILAFRKQAIALSGNAAAHTRRRGGQANQMALLFKTWNAWRDGVSVASLSWRGGGKHAEPFPIPE